MRESFHGDVIQRLVSGYSSHQFETTVYFPSRDGHCFPVIQVPSGLTTPAACRADLRIEDLFLLRESEIYVRTLASNGTVSSARATWKDLESLMSRCHDNREADLARVFGRMAQGISRESLSRILNMFAEIGEGLSHRKVTPSKLLNEGATRFSAIAQEKALDLPPHGCWDTALVLEGQVPHHRPNREFLQRLASANPNLTGWPVWLDSSQFFDQGARPYVANNCWEAFMFEAPSNQSAGHMDFWILDPIGRFFLRRAHQDDIGGGKTVKPLGFLDPYLAILRVAEALSVGQAFARALGCDEQTTQLSFSFRWSKLRGRRLEVWSSGGGDGRIMSLMSSEAKTDDVQSLVMLPQLANEEGVCLATHEAILPLLGVFGGYEPSYELTRSLVLRLLHRKLR